MRFPSSDRVSLRRRVFQTLPILAALLPTLVASAIGWLPQMRGFAVGAFILVMVAIWLPQTWKTFAVLAVANALGAIAYVLSAHLAPPFWPAVAFLAIVGYAGGLLTKRFGALVPLVITAGAACGLNASTASASKDALLLGLGGLWSIICGLGIPRAASPAANKNAATSFMPSFYPVRCALTLAAALIIGHWLWPGFLGWAPVAAAAVLRPDLAAIGRRGAWRIAATLAGVALSALLLALQVAPFPALAFLVLLLCVAHAFDLDPTYTIPLVGTTIVLTVLGYAQPEALGAAFVQRTVVTILGVVVAWTFVWIPTSVSEARR